ncbi:hypothetical protein RDABS01_037296 [Bienertia sinuspersici]
MADSQQENQVERVDKKRDEEDGESEEEIEWNLEADDEEAKRAELMLIGKLWAKKNVNPNALIDTLTGIWNPRNGLEARRIDKNMFSFQLFHYRDKARVLDGQPWHFDKYPLCLSAIDEDGKPIEKDLHTIPVWVRFYNLPFRGRGDVGNAQMLASKIGTFLQFDKSYDIEIERSIRIRVLVDVEKPLKDTVKLKIRGGDSIKIMVKYERLPLFCFICGKLGHGDRECDAHNDDPSPKKKFGTWLRASPWKPKNSQGREDNKGETSVKRNLFVVKPLQKDEVEGVVKNMGAVSLNIDDDLRQLQKLASTNAQPTDEEGGAAAVENSVEKLKVTQEKSPVSQSTHECTGLKARKWKKIERDTTTENVVEGRNCGTKRASLWDTDGRGEDVIMEDAGAAKKMMRKAFEKGGLALLWRSNVDITMRNFSLNHIDVQVNPLDINTWPLTGIYGFPEGDQKFKTGKFWKA